MFRPMTSPRFRLVIVEILSWQWQWKWWWVQRWLWRRWWWWSLVISTQEELAASKLREAESNLALKDLRSKVSDFDFEKKNMMISWLCQFWCLQPRWRSWTVCGRSTWKRERRLQLQRSIVIFTSDKTQFNFCSGTEHPKKAAWVPARRKRGAGDNNRKICWKNMKS